MNLRVNTFFQTFFRKVEHLTVEGDVHLNAFAFLWAHCQALKYLKIGKTYIIIYLKIDTMTARDQQIYSHILFISGLVIADEMTNANVLIMDVFTALFRVSIQVAILKPQRLTFYSQRS